MIRLTTANKLPPKQQSFMMALMRSPTIEGAIEQSGISKSTAYRYLNNRDFKAALYDLRRQTMSQVTASLQQASFEAVRTLQDVMNDSDNSTPASRVQAARAILDNAYKGIELEDLAKRITELENITKQN